MKRLLSLLMLAAAVSVAGCNNKKKPASAPANSTDLNQTPPPQAYQPTANNTSPEPEPGPQPAPEAAPTHHDTHTSNTSSSTGHRHHVKYVVKKGDTMSKIAKDHHVSLKHLEAANPKVDPNKIKVGETIMIP